MNEFNLFKQLCLLEDIAGRYPAGGTAAGRIRELQERISSRRYRVAVVGEFKRGKSSLINALLGTEVLPSDILPTTAVIHRIVYGEQAQILLRRKDGRTERRPLHEIADYGTKLDAEKAQTASALKEIVVEYPTAFCASHIELIDTPGLNDMEQMTEKTLCVLEETDSAVMVLSAREPLSMTEQDLIRQILERPGIRHITFVVTFLDTFEEAEEQDRILDFIRNRLEHEVYSLIAAKHGGNGALMKKADAILHPPQLFGVSSSLALKSFVTGDPAALAASRFPAFKSGLLALLTAGQSADLFDAAACCAEEVQAGLPDWKEARKAELERDFQQAETLYKGQTAYREHSRMWLQNRLLNMESRLEKPSIPELSGSLRREFIKRLSALREDTATEDQIRRCLQEGKTAAEAILSSVEAQRAASLEREMERVFQDFAQMRRCWPDAGGLDQELAAWRGGQNFPKFVWTKPIILEGACLADADVMPAVCQAIEASLQNYEKWLEAYTASWRVILLRQNRRDLENPTVSPAPDEERLALRRLALEDQYRKDAAAAAAIVEALRRS